MAVQRVKGVSSDDLLIDMMTLEEIKKINGDGINPHTNLPSIEQTTSKQTSDNSHMLHFTSMDNKPKVSNPDKWKRNIAKTKRNSGEEYVSRSGKQVSAKIFDNVDCGCKMNCVTRFSAQERELIFKRYWNFSAEAKLVFICGHVQQINIDRHKSRLGENSKRKKSCSYFLPQFDNSMVRVCKVYFRHSLQISNGALGRALKRANDMDFTDRRGKKEPGNKKSKEEIQVVIDHINSFPVLQNGLSHKSKTSYLPEHLNLKVMYRMYQQACTYKKPVSETLYKKVFYTRFNLKFKKTTREICSRCERSTAAKHEEQKSCVCPNTSAKVTDPVLPQQPSPLPHTQTASLPPSLQQPHMDYIHGHSNALNTDMIPMNYYRTNMWMQHNDHT